MSSCSQRLDYFSVSVHQKIYFCTTTGSFFQFDRSFDDIFLLTLKTSQLTFKNIVFTKGSISHFLALKSGIHVMRKCVQPSLITLTINMVIFSFMLYLFRTEISQSLADQLDIFDLQNVFLSSRALYLISQVNFIIANVIFFSYFVKRFICYGHW